MGRAENITRRIADLSDDERPREKALANGIRSLSDAELLALLIGGGVPGKSAIDLAREILDSCNNSINNLARLSIQAISRRFVGIGPAKATTIAAAIELGSRRKSGHEKISSVRSVPIMWSRPVHADSLTSFCPSDKSPSGISLFTPPYRTKGSML